jgi:hypothetical protein
VKGLIIPVIHRMMSNATVGRALNSLFDQSLLDVSSVAKADATLNIVKTK